MLKQKLKDIGIPQRVIAEESGEKREIVNVILDVDRVTNIWKTANRLYEEKLEKLRQ